eukprot:4712567-Prymnesium_polylepis.1
MGSRARRGDQQGPTGQARPDGQQGPGPDGATARPDGQQHGPMGSGGACTGMSQGRGPGQ